VITISTTAVTINSTVCNAAASRVNNAANAPHTPLTFVNLGRRRVEDDFRCFTADLLDQVDIRSLRQ
jgi:hypothetical protein